MSVKRHPCTDPETCRKCRHAAIGRVYYASHKAQEVARKRAYRGAHKSEARTYRRDHYVAHRDRELAQQRAYYLDHKDRELAYQRAYRAAEPARVKASKQAWRDANPDRIKSYQQMYSKTPAGKASHVLATHRRREVTQSPESKALTVEVLSDIKIAWKQRCAYCGKTGILLEIDHLIPISRGGKHSVFNVVPACMSCNRRKGTRDPREFLSKLLRGVTS